MKSAIELNWKKNMAFEANVGGHKLMIDAGAAVGGEGKGPTPKPLMLVALAGCTAMDVVSILKKMRVEIDDFNVKVEADMTEEHPKHYNAMHVVYELWGKDIPIEKVEKAVNLSKERYCGVAAVYEKVMPLTHEIRLNP